MKECFGRDIKKERDQKKSTFNVKVRVNILLSDIMLCGHHEVYTFTFSSTFQNPDRYR